MHSGSIFQEVFMRGKMTFLRLADAKLVIVSHLDVAVKHRFTKPFSFHVISLLSYAGQILFHGPCTEVVPFFNQLGFQRPARKGVAAFLQEVISSKDQKVSPHPFSCMTGHAF